MSIHGKYLHAGSKIQIFVGDQECHLLETDVNSITSKPHLESDTNILMADSFAELESIVEPEEEILRCRTSKLAFHSDQPIQSMPRLVKREALWNGTITILIDNYTETYLNISYAYTEVLDLMPVIRIIHSFIVLTILFRIQKYMI